MESYGVLAQLTTDTATLEDIYECPVDTEAIIKNIVVADPGTGETIRLVLETGSTSLLLPDTVLYASGHGEFTGAVTLRAGDKLQSFASGAVDITVFGAERDVS